MDQIPRHVLYRIFKDLHYQQKKECKRVCRSWAQCLQNGLDLETISLLDEPESHAFVRSLKGPAITCKRLVLNRFKPLDKLVALFPRLQFAAFIDDDGRSDDEEEEEEEEEENEYADYTPEEARQFDGWHQHLETYIDFRYSYEIIKFLSTGQFQKLATLELRHTDYGGSPLEKLITCLKNTPQLRTLKIELFAFGYQDLNDLNEAVPRLHTLVLDNCTVTHPDPPSQLTTTPAESMKRLDIIEDDEYSSFCQSMYAFMARKYPKLEYLTLPTTLDASLYPSIPRGMLSNNNLIELNLDEEFDTPDIMNTVIQYLPSSLKQLSLSMNYAPSVRFTLMEFLLGSNIVSLKLMKMPASDIHLLNGMSNLKQLQLVFVEEEWETGDFDAILNTLVNELPASLETLGLSRCVLSVDSEQPAQWRHSSLTCLELHKCKIKDDLSPYLSSDHFPKLHALTLKGNTMKHNLILPDQRFTLVDIYLPDMALKVDGKMYRHFPYSQQPVLNAHFNVNDHAMYLVSSPAALMYDCFFQFECKSVQTLLYNGLLVLG